MAFPVNPDAMIYYGSGAMLALYCRDTVEGTENGKRLAAGLFSLLAAAAIYYIGSGGPVFHPLFFAGYVR